MNSAFQLDPWTEPSTYLSLSLSLSLSLFPPPSLSLLPCLCVLEVAWFVLRSIAAPPFLPLVSSLHVFH